MAPKARVPESVVKEPKTVLDKIVHAIRESPPNQNGGVSRLAICKYIKSEFHYDNAAPLKQALKRGVDKGILTQGGQSFSVTSDPPRIPKQDGPVLQVEDVQIGTGPGATAGDLVTVQYMGTLQDKTQFDAASKFDFVLGAGDVIKGWDQGLAGMAKGGKRTLVVPPQLGYGKRGCAPDIPPNATLNFMVTMKNIAKSP